MAIAKRSRDSGDKEAPPAKRAKDEEEEEDEEDDDEEDEDDEEGDEDDEELGSDDDDSEEFDMEDFEDVEDMTEEKLATFNEAYKKFCEERDNESGEERVCLVFGTPTDIRPVPQTPDEFKAKTPYVFLDAAGQDFMETFGEKYMMAFASNMPDEEDEEEEEPAEDVDVSKGYEAQLKVLTKTLEEVKSMDPKERWQAGIALVHQVLEDNPGNLFESGEKGEECSAVLTKLAETWSELLKLDDTKMGLYAGARDQLKKMLKSLVDRLEDKEFAKGAYQGKFKVVGL